MEHQGLARMYPGKETTTTKQNNKNHPKFSFSEIFKSCLDVGLGTLLWVFLPDQVLGQMDQEVPDSFGDSGILWINKQTNKTIHTSQTVREDTRTKTCSYSRAVITCSSAVLLLSIIEYLGEKSHGKILWKHLKRNHRKSSHRSISDISSILLEEKESVYKPLYSSEIWILVQNSTMQKKIIIERVLKGFSESNELDQIWREGQ